MIPDRPRRIQKKEIAAEIGVHPATLSGLVAAGLRLPQWPCTMADCVASVRNFRAGEVGRRETKGDEEKRSAGV